MTPMQRLVESNANSFEAELLRSARRDGANANPQRTLQALGLTVSLVTAQALSEKAVLKTVGGTAIKSALWKGVAVVGIGFLGTAGWITWEFSKRPAVSAMQSASEPVMNTLPRAPSLAPPSVAAAQSAEPLSGEAPSEPAHASRPKPRARRAVAGQDSLLAEVALLDKARGHLSRGAAGDALRILSRYSRRFPRGRLAAEAGVIRIQALRVRDGQPATRAAAETFLRNHPNSPHAPLLRGLLEPAAKEESR
jgi:hypothetical protein